MAKKFLLYIYNPLFDKEKKKSGLINKLLDAHYERKRKDQTKKVGKDSEKSPL